MDPVQAALDELPSRLHADYRVARACAALLEAYELRLTESLLEDRRQFLCGLLAARGFELSERDKAYISSERRPQVLGRWQLRAVTAASLEDVFDAGADNTQLPQSPLEALVEEVSATRREALDRGDNLYVYGYGLALEHVEGELQGKRADLLIVLSARGFSVPEETESRIVANRDHALLDRWLCRAVTAPFLDDVFAND